MRAVRGPGSKLFFIESIGFTLLAVGFSALILHTALTDGEATLTQRVLRNKVLSKFGKYSYGIYVYHVPLLGASLALTKERFGSVKGQLWFGALSVALLFAGSFLIAVISYEGFERRFLNLKRYFEPKKVEVPEITAAEMAI